MGNNGVQDKKRIPFELNGTIYKLTPREHAFCFAYVGNGGVLSKAVWDSGYNAKNIEVASSTGAELLRRPQVAGFIHAIREDICAQLGIHAVDIAREYAKIGFSDFRRVFDPETGQILEPKDMDNATAAAVQSIDVTEVYDPRTGNFIGKNKKLKFHDKLVALDKLAKMLGVDSKPVKIAAETAPKPLEITIKHTKAQITSGND